MSSDYVIAIPSYKREDTLLKNTLKILRKHGISHTKIKIFVADEEQLYAYKNVIPPMWYDKITVAVSGMGSVRNYMTSHFSEGKKIFYMDDDIREVFILENRTERRELEDLDSLIRKGFEEIEKRKLRLFGIYPVPNPYFRLKDEYKVGLSYIIGSMYGVINDRSIKVTMDDKEDYQRSILYFIKYGANFRFNWVSPLTSYYKEKGGMQETRTKERVLSSAVELSEAYPELCSLNLDKKSGYAEIKFNRSRKFFST